MVAIILNCSLLVHRNSTEGPRCPVWWFHSGYPEHEHLSFLWASRELGSWPRWWLRWKSICLQCGRPGFNPWVGKISWRRQWQPTLVFLPGKSHGRRSLVGYSPRRLKDLDMTERLHFHPAYSFPVAAVSPTIVYCLCLASWSLTMSRWKVDI